MRKLVLAIALATMLSPVFAGEEELYGTWKLVSSQRKIVDTGEILNTFGESPSGFITYGKDGRMSAILVRNDRPKAESIDKMTDVQRAELFRTMLAYAGTYKFNGTSIEHHIDISWNEVWTGTTQIRDVSKEGNRLIYTTRPAPFPGDGKMSIATVVWEKVQ